MGQSTKAVCGLVLIVAAITFAMTFGFDPGRMTWIVRIGAIVAGVLSLALFLKLEFRKDILPDLLKNSHGQYYNRDGFGFAIDLDIKDGFCVLRAFYQNQFENPCEAQVAIRPLKSAFLPRPKIESILFEIPCSGAEYGMVSKAIPLPRNQQGKRRWFEVAARVRYPDGRGRRLRFYDGLTVSTDLKFRHTSHKLLTLVTLFAGSMYLYTGSKLKITLPFDVSDKPPLDSQQVQTPLWTLNDATPEMLFSIRA